MELTISENPTSEEYEGDVSPSDVDDKPVFDTVFYHIRYTFDNQDAELKCLEDKAFINRCRKIHQGLVKQCYRYVSNDKLTTGFEVMNKKGLSCRAHCHICFGSRHSKESMRTQFVRYLGKDGWGEETKGQHHLRFELWKRLREGEYAFYQYPIKMNYLPQLQMGFSSEELEKMHYIAKNSYMKVVEVNQAKQDKQDNQDTLFQRIKTVFEKSGVNTTRELLKIAIDFYIKEEKPLNAMTIQGYVLNYMISEGHMSADEYIDKYMRV